MSEQEEEIEHAILSALMSGDALSVKDIFPRPKEIHYKVMSRLNKEDVVAVEPNRKFTLR